MRYSFSCHLDINTREEKEMNSTTNQTTITVTTATGKAQCDSQIKKVVIYDRYGRAHKVERLRGIVI
jgi:ABC-type enterochelin transport system substrate-binding protein